MQNKENGTIDFTENDIDSLDLTSEENFGLLIVKYLCGKNLKSYDLDPETRAMVGKFQKNIGREGLNFEQFNELLLLLNQDRISEDFFVFFFEGTKINLEKLKRGVVKFRGLAMLYFGNFRFAYKELSKKTRQELEKTFESSHRLRSAFFKRPSKVLDIEKIDRKKTWYLGYISGAKINKEAELLDCSKNFKEARTKFKPKLKTMRREAEEVQRIATNNTDVYLTWDYIDVYVATSMRNSWEFEEAYDFVEELCKERSIKNLKLRFFDPTQSKCNSPKDKGLIEGLMLRRALITIYMAQESDTMGKDSELAATLAQSKPVIAYVPKYTPSKYAERIESYPLDYFKKRILLFKAEELFEDEKLEKSIKERYCNFEDLLDDFLKKYAEYRKKQPFTLWDEKDQEFAERCKDFPKVVEILAIAECFHFEKRAQTLRKSHPLSMQVDVHSGVANGVLVVRDVKQCSSLIDAILRNNMQFEIKHEQEGYYILMEKISESPFRVITDYEKLTNSFWNFFAK